MSRPWSSTWIAVANVEHQVHVVVDQQHGHAGGRRLGAAAGRDPGSRRCRGRRRARRAAAAGAAGQGPAHAHQLALALGQLGRCRGRGGARSRAARQRRATAVVGPPATTPGRTRSSSGRHHEGRAAATSRLPRTSRSSNSSTDWKRAYQARAGTGGGAAGRRCGRPSSSTEPVGGVNPVSASMNVVLPAPFGPMRPTSVPGRPRSDTSLRATHAAVADGQGLGLAAASGLAPSSGQGLLHERQQPDPTDEGPLRAVLGLHGAASRARRRRSGPHRGRVPRSRSSLATEVIRSLSGPSVSYLARPVAEGPVRGVDQGLAGGPRGPCRPSSGSSRRRRTGRRRDRRSRWSRRSRCGRRPSSLRTTRTGGTRPSGWRAPLWKPSVQRPGAEQRPRPRPAADCTAPMRAMSSGSSRNRPIWRSWTIARYIPARRPGVADAAGRRQLGRQRRGRVPLAGHQVAAVVEQHERRDRRGSVIASR